MKLRLIALFIFCFSVANGLNASMARATRTIAGAATRAFTHAVRTCTTNTTASVDRATRAHTADTVFIALYKETVNVYRLAKTARACATDAVPGSVEYDDLANHVTKANANFNDHFKLLIAAAKVAKNAHKELAAMQAADTATVTPLLSLKDSKK